MGRALRNGVGIGISNIPALSSLPIATRLYLAVRNLFADGSQGAWYDNSNMSTLFQDAAGTTPAVLESPVGKQLDLSGRGNHRSQATSANRPLLSARYNLLTKTEDFSNVAWSNLNVTLTKNAAIAPDGTLTANLAAINNATAQTSTFQNIQLIALNTYRIYVVAKQAGVNYLNLGIVYSAGNYAGAQFNLSNGSVGLPIFSGSGYLASAPTITTLGNGWYACSITIISGLANSYPCFIPSNTVWTSGRPDQILTGDGASGIYIWHPDLRPTDQTVTLPAYQRVDTSTVYDTAGFPQYIKYNGSNQFLSTASVDFTATAQMSVFAGVRKLDDVVSLILESSTNGSSNAGGFYLANRGISSGDFTVAMRSTNFMSAQVFATPPTTKVIDFQINTAGATQAQQIAVSLNAVLQAPTYSGTLAAGNFNNYPLYFGMRAGTSLPFNGQEYQMIIVGKTLTATQITSTETYVNGKTKAYA